jgi:hypothetical protein
VSDHLDNLALVDWMLGELRHAMERAVLWDNCTVLLTALHPLRVKMWSVFPQIWTHEDAGATGNQGHRRVPFILKMPGQRNNISYKTGFNSILARDLILGLLRGDVTTPEGAARWLDRNRGQAPAP